MGTKHVNPYTNTTKTHSVFKRYVLLATFKSRESTHACVRHGELLHNAHVSFFNHWIRACVHVFVYLASVIRVDRERSGSEVARVLHPRQRD